MRRVRVWVCCGSCGRQYLAQDQYAQHHYLPVVATKLTPSCILQAADSLMVPVPPIFGRGGEQVPNGLFDLAMSRFDTIPSTKQVASESLCRSTLCGASWQYCRLSSRAACYRSAVWGVDPLAIRQTGRMSEARALAKKSSKVSGNGRSSNNEQAFYPPEARDLTRLQIKFRSLLQAAFDEMWSMQRDPRCVRGMQ